MPSLFQATDVTWLECPFIVDSHSKVPAEPTDHIRTVVSSLPEASLVPSLFQATDMTKSQCPFNVDWHFPVHVSQILTLWSLLPLATCLPSGLHATDKTLRFR